MPLEAFDDAITTEQLCPLPDLSLVRSCHGANLHSLAADAPSLALGLSPLKGGGAFSSILAEGHKSGFAGHIVSREDNLAYANCDPYSYHEWFDSDGKCHFLPLSEQPINYYRSYKDG